MAPSPDISLCFLLFCIAVLAPLVGGQQLTNSRPPPKDRLFVSPVIDRLIADYAKRMKDKDLATVFENAFPNTLDTTVHFTKNASSITGKQPDTFIVTGDIDAMWTRDSTNQVLPYISFANQDSNLRDMLHGLINRQVYNLLLDPYANAYNKDTSNPSPFMSDNTWKPGFLGTQVPVMNLHLHERKFELDSILAFLKLSTEYYRQTKDQSPFDADWLSATGTVIAMIKQQQEDSDQVVPYFFQRQASEPTDTLLHGVGAPASRTGMAKSPFRPSDDASTYPFPIAANAMAVVSLQAVAQLLRSLTNQQTNESRVLANQAEQLAQEITQGIQNFGVMSHTKFGNIYAYEVDGFGSVNFMDDANVPSLLSLPYLGFCSKNDSLYLKTRKFLLSDSNPYYSLIGFHSPNSARSSASLKGGIGGPHIGRGWIWPMSIIMQGLTGQQDDEIRAVLELLKTVSFNTNGFIHESFWKDDYTSYTRPWFAWANSLFGELILTVAKERPYLIF